MIPLLLWLLADQPAKPVDPRIEVARAVVAVVEAERDEARAEAERLRAILRKLEAASKLEAAKSKLPNWKPGSLLTEQFTIHTEEQKK